MKSVLVIGSAYFDTTDANGICIRNIAQEYAQRGYEVFVISGWDQSRDEERTDGRVQVFLVKQPWFDRVKQFREKGGPFREAVYQGIARIRHIALIPFYPNVSPLRSVRVSRMAENLVRQHGIGTVLCTYRPFEAIHTALRLKKRLGSRVKVVCGHLDLLLSPDMKAGTVKRFKEAMARRVAAQEKQLADGIILPENMAGQAQAGTRVAFSGFPVYVPDGGAAEMTDTPFAPEVTNIAYIGTLNMSNRDPSYALALMDAARRRTAKPVCFHVWGRMEPEVLTKLRAYDFVTYHGTVEQKQVMGLLRASGLLLNITNGNTFNMLPSKIFQMFAAQRPIINVVKDRRDCTLPYFARYGHAFSAYEDAGIDGQAEALAAFIDACGERDIPFPEDLVVGSTPAHYVDLVEKM